MEIRFIDNQVNQLGDLLSAELKASTDTRIAVAFASQSGVAVLEEAIMNGLALGGRAEFLVGLEFGTTEARALQTLFGWTRQNEGFHFYVLPPGGPVIYHPKLYLMEAGDYGVVVVGSSNLTQGGLFKNAEANMMVKAARDGEIYTGARETFIRLKFDNRRVPDEEFILNYEDAAKRISKARKSFTKSEAYKLSKQLGAQFEKLPKPDPSRADLVGWLEMVYDVLPDGEFSTSDVYAHEDEFQSRYPENKNVRAKIRQQLQFLRDMGLLEHLSTNRWEKL